MKKLLLCAMIMASSVSVSFGMSVTVIPYSVDPKTGKTLILLGREARCWAVPHAVRIFSPGLAASLHMPVYPTELDFAVGVFNKKTMFSFARAVIDAYPDSPKASRADPEAGYSHFIADESADIEACACAEAVRECRSSEGAYGAITCAKENFECACGLMLESWCITPGVKAFDDATRSALLEQRRETPVIQVHGHNYYFLLVPFIPANFLMAKRAYLQKVFPGSVGLSFGNFTPASKVVGYLGAALEAFAWVDKDVFVDVFRTAMRNGNYTHCLVRTSEGFHCKLNKTLASCLCNDVGVIDAIEGVVGHV